MSDIKSVDGQFGYYKTDQPGQWRKVRLADNQTVSTIELGGGSEAATVPRHRKQEQYPKHRPKMELVGPVAPKKVDDHLGSCDDYSSWEGSSYFTTPPHSLPTVPPAEKRANAAKKSAYGRYGRNFCNHDGRAKVLELDGREFYAAGIGFIRPAEYDLVLDLADTLSPPYRRKWSDEPVILPGSPDKFQYLNRYQVVDGKMNRDWKPEERAKHIVHFRWADQAALTSMSVEFWEHLYDALPKGKILVCCVGSHGRTGTALACLMLAAGAAASAFEAVLRVRVQHCESAIESHAQLGYIDRLAHVWGYEGATALSANNVIYGGAADALRQLKEAEDGKAKN